MIKEALFGAGCFWGVQRDFDQIPGVLETQVGYAGGALANPTYQQVCAHQTGHAEVVWIRFDADKLSYNTLLEAFFSNHNPTTLNRQGPDIGTQYRSVIFYFDEEQAQWAKAYVLELERTLKFHAPIVTQIIPWPTFYPAEEYHQKYLEKRGGDRCGV